MKNLSAGLLMYRIRNNEVEFYLVHPGGPFWAKKDEGSWSIPKGLVENSEDILNTAIREFTEETGFIPEGPFIELGEVKMKSGKRIMAWAFQKDIGEAVLTSNTFTMEWPPKSGIQTEFPEVDRGEYFDLETGRRKLNPAQVDFLDRLCERLK